MENIKKKIEELRSLKAMAEELAAEITSIEDEIKAFMGDEEEIRAGDYKVRYKTVRSSRFDSTAFKATHAVLYAQYTKETVTRRFSIA